MFTILLNYTMQLQLSKGIWLNQVSDRFCTITSTLPNAAPDYRVSYFGFDKWAESTKFVFRVKRLRADIRCEARHSKRLGTKFEVKVWNLTKEEARLLWSELGGHTVTFAPTPGKGLVTLYLNGLRVVSIQPGDQTYANEFVSKLNHLSHAEAREAIVKRFFMSQPIAV